MVSLAAWPQVDFGGCVDRDEVGFVGHDAGVVGPIDGHHFDRSVVVEPAQQCRCADHKSGHVLVAVLLFAGAGGHTAVDERGAVAFSISLRRSRLRA
jgi:hypothetical protein